MTTQGDAPRAPSAPPAASPKRAIVRVVGTLLGLSLLAWVIHNIVTEAQKQVWSWSDMRIGYLALAAAVLAFAYLSRAMVWVHTLRDHVADAGMVPGMKVFLGSQMGRYIPGKAWQIAGAAWLGARAGLPAAACGTNTTMTMIIHNGVGALMGLFVLWRFEEYRQGVLILLGLVLVLLVVLARTSLPARALRLVGRVTKRDIKLEMPKTSSLIAMALSSLWMWLLFGVSLWLAIAGLLPDANGPSLQDCISTMAASSVIGFAVLIAPSGIGVREALVVALFSSALGEGGAGLVAIGSRILMTAVELLLAGWAFTGKGRTTTPPA